ncbi:MAG: hypothetical protein U9P00_12490 [Pseudomonadota bacterium]|nr:hypothetical protein [Pseudomonadota bacterium]
MNPMLYRYLLIVLFVVSVIVLLVVGFERGLRYFTGEPAGPIKYRQHPTALATVVPDLKKKHDDWRGMHTYRTNANGVRDDGPLCQRANVLLFGDSNVFAKFLPYDKTLGEQVEDLFDGDVCTINLGVPGYGPDQSLLRMLYEIDYLDLSPEVIVFHVFADNDYGDMFRNYLFTLDEAGNLQQTNRDRIDYKLRTMERLQAQYLLVRRFRDLLINTGFYRMPLNEYVPEREGYDLERPLGSAAETSRYIEHFEAVTRDEFESYKNGRYTTWLGDLYDYYIALNPDSEAARYARQLLTAIFRQGQKKTEELGACFVVLIQPSEWDVGETGPIPYRDLDSFSDTFKRHYHRRNLTDIAKAAAIASGAAYIDLFDLYTNPGAGAYTSYLHDKGDNHWNTRGVQIAAEAIAGFITENDCFGMPHY